jgi:hypothetical protein
MSDMVSEHPAAVCFANDPVMCNRGGLNFASLRILMRVFRASLLRKSMLVVSTV